jgi:hypothetical protein
MPPPGVPEHRDRRLSFSIALAAASVVLAIAVSGVFADASVWAGDQGDRRQCGTVLDPNAETSACATALRGRSWMAAGLLGAALFGAVGAAVIAGSEPSRRTPRLAAVAVAAGVVVVGGALLWGGVIDRTVGS